MRLNLARMIPALVGGALLTTGAASASPQGTAAVTPPATQPSAHLADRASTLLAEIQREAVGLRRNAATLGTYARNTQYSWQSHAGCLDRVKVHINEVGERIAELQQIRNSVHPWQQQATTELTTHAVQVATSTQAAIVQLNENRNSRIISEYQAHLMTIDDSSADMQERVNKFLDYENAQQKFLQLQEETGTGG